MTSPRPRFFAASLAVLVVLGSGLARAHHDDGDPANGTFNPQFSVALANQLANQTSDVTVKLAQEDHEDPVVRATFRFPGEWQFDKTFARIRGAGKDAAGTPVSGSLDARCKQTVDGRDDGTNGNARMTRAEHVGTAFLSAQVDGITRPGSPLVFNGEIGFLGWDAASTTADLCLLLVTNDPRVPSSITDPSDPSRQINTEGATEIAAGFQFNRVNANAGTCSPGFTLSGGTTWWQSCADLSDLATDTTLQLLNASMIEFRAGYFGLSEGNWNGSRAAVSRTPDGPGNYAVVGVFETCPKTSPDPRDGKDYHNCKSNYGYPTPPVVRRLPITITMPVSGAHPLPTLLSPAPYSVVDGTAAARVQWKENLHDEPPAGYVVTLARPGETDEKSIYRKRFVSADAGYPCDAANLCTLDFRFPYTLDSGATLPANAKYAVTIVPIFADGHRSDGRCDDGTIAGKANCGAAVTSPPGWASAEFLLSARKWPLHYSDSTAYDKRPDRPVTHDALLVDPGTGYLQYVVWNSGGAPFVYGGRDDRIVTDGTQGLFTFFGSGKNVAESWSVHGGFAPQNATALFVRPANSVWVPDAPQPPTLDGTYQPPFPQRPSQVPRSVTLPVSAPQPYLFVGVPV
jgi:hypothetical protein